MAATDLATPQRAADAVGISVSAVHRMIHQGKLQGRKASDKRTAPWMISISDVRNLVHVEQPILDTTWMKRSACRGMDPNIFNPERGSATYRLAKNTCAICPVRLACLDYAIAADMRHGMWGGMTPRARGVKGHGY